MPFLYGFFETNPRFYWGFEVKNIVPYYDRPATVQSLTDGRQGPLLKTRDLRVSDSPVRLRLSC